MEYILKISEKTDNFIAYLAHKHGKTKLEVLNGLIGAGGDIAYYADANNDNKVIVFPADKEFNIKDARLVELFNLD